jgi:hypothetical protein
VYEESRGSRKKLVVEEPQEGELAYTYEYYQE